MRSRYDGIADLNKRWGNALRSHDYQRFEQVKVPLRIDAQLWLKYNPSIELEFMRFGSKTIVEYCGKQASVLRRHTERTITTNTDPFFYGDNVSLADLFRDPDIGGIDVYSSWAYTITSWDQGTGKWLYPLYMLLTVYKSLFDQNVFARFVYDEQNLGELEWLVLPWHLLHDEALENSLIRFVHEGGNLVVTDDLFQKNNFIYPQGQDGSFQIMQSKAGKGTAWMLRKDTDESGWKAFIDEFITS